MARTESASPTPEDGVTHPSFDYTDGSELSDQGEVDQAPRGGQIPKSGDAKQKKDKSTPNQGAGGVSSEDQTQTQGSSRALEHRSYIAPIEDDDGDDEDEEEDEEDEEDELDIQVGDGDDDDNEEVEEDDEDEDDEDEDEDEDDEEDEEDDDEEESDDGDQDDSDNESVTSGKSIHLSTKQKGELEAWIKYSEDPAPSTDDVSDKCRELYGYGISNYDKNDIEEHIVERILNGPPIKKDLLMAPGFGLPIIYKIKNPDERAPFLLGLDEDWEAATLTNREICMLKFIEDITNKPNWWKKVRDPRIAKKWKEEVVKMPWTQYRKYGNFTEQMADTAIEELLKKADLYEETGLVPVFDYSACVIKSDSLMTEEMAAALKTAVAPLENVDESQKDWHPNSNNQVLDLVHPSLCPLVYGLSRVVPEKRIPLEDCLQYCGSGVPVPVADMPDLPRATWDSENYLESHAVSRRFQWLPCDVDLTGETPRIDSYINNLHPVEHKELYPVIEKFIAKSLPAWDIVWRWPEEFQTQRIVVEDLEHKCNVPDICGDYCSMSNNPDFDAENDDSSDAEELNERWWDETHTLIVPDADSEMEEVVQVDAKEVLSSGFFDHATRAQVIVKLANIHLTPENPKYNGGSWHVEGQYNEHICATALYYYDTENITDCYLDFRTQADEEELSQELSYAQGEFHPIEQLYDIDASGDKLQTIGSVLTRQGRAVFFPNVYQHHVSPFELADKTRPGHRKILALFLIDPQIPVLSTANVPPQQQAWWDLSKAPILGKLPPELMETVKRDVEFPIATEAAKKLRLELMEERSAKLEEYDTHFKGTEWGFCEH